jgi:hypothetical protein
MGAQEKNLRAGEVAQHAEQVSLSSNPTSSKKIEQSLHFASVTRK